MDEKKKKRWLIVVVVVACVGIGGLFLLGIVAGIAVPAWMSSERAANERVTIAKLYTLITEERAYLREHGSYATFDQLIADGALDKRFAGESPTVEDYTYTLRVTQKDNGVSPCFSVNADPQQGEGFRTTGRRHFYTDSTGTVIRVSEDRPATADDPPLEEK